MYCMYYLLWCRSYGNCGNCGTWYVVTSLKYEKWIKTKEEKRWKPKLPTTDRKHISEEQDRKLSARTSKPPKAGLLLSAPVWTFKLSVKSDMTESLSSLSSSESEIGSRKLRWVSPPSKPPPVSIQMTSPSLKLAPISPLGGMFDEESLLVFLLDRKKYCRTSISMPNKSAHWWSEVYNSPVHQYGLFRPWLVSNSTSYVIDTSSTTRGSISSTSPRFLRLVLGPNVFAVDDVVRCSSPLFRFSVRGESTFMSVLVFNTHVTVAADAHGRTLLVRVEPQPHPPGCRAQLKQVAFVHLTRQSFANSTDVCWWHWCTDAPSTFTVDLRGIKSPLLGASMVDVAVAADSIMLLLLGDRLLAWIMIHVTGGLYK